jgi:hypothetical protein
MSRLYVLPLAASLLALLPAPPAAAEIYKWVDEKGVVNYGTTPPSGRAVKELPKEAPGVTVVPAPPPLPPAAARNPTDERVERLENALAAEKAARDAQEQRAEERRRAAVAQCEENRGVDCEENPYQYGSAIAPVIVRRHALQPPFVAPPPAPPVKPRPPPEPRRGVVGKARPPPQE